MTSYCDSNYSSEEVAEQLQNLHQFVQAGFERRIVALFGEISWSRRALEHFLTHLPDTSALCVGKAVHALKGEQIEGHQLTERLGDEVDLLIWSGFDGLNPDGLAAASGLIRGGGLLLLLLPNADDFISQADADYTRMCREEEDLQTFGTRFLKHLRGLLSSHPGAVEIHQQIKHGALPAFTHNPDINPAHSGLITLSTKDQERAIQAILRVAKGHAKRPLILQANRGRGKSSALGIAAANLSAFDGKHVILTAPSTLASKICLMHYDREFKRLSKKSDSLKAGRTGSLRFMSPDALLQELPACDVLLVDEAASLPVPLLEDLCKHYTRLVFSTTIHGYEGTGRGFTLRFEPRLRSRFPSTQCVELLQPIRWASDDPLEAFMFRTLFLDSELSLTSNTVDVRNDSAKVHWVSQDTLVRNDRLLEQTIALLTLAHYQTRPSDIRLLLDHPAVKLALAMVNDQVVGALLVIEEGKILTNELAQGLVEGRRRPRGHLIPQSLTTYSCDARWLEWSGIRIVRVAVTPQLHSQGIGSKLVGACVDFATNQGKDYVATSFGLYNPLVSFWRSNGFRCLRIGYHRDASSGEHSAVMLKPLANALDSACSAVQQRFLHQFLTQLPTLFRNLPWPEATTMLEDLIPAPADALPRNLLAEVRAYAEHYRSLDDTLLSLHTFLLYCISTKVFQRLDARAQKLCISLIFQQKEWAEIGKIEGGGTGKKALSRDCRGAIRTLIQTINEKTS